MRTPAQLWCYFESLLYLWRKTRGNLCTKEQMEERFKICTTCEHFRRNHCLLCGCNCNDKRGYFNKIAFPTEECPDQPPKWRAVNFDNDTSLH